VIAETPDRFAKDGTTIERCAASAQRDGARRDLAAGDRIEKPCGDDDGGPRRGGESGGARIGWTGVP
jgi:hypothetical protein